MIILLFNMDLYYLIIHQLIKFKNFKNFQKFILMLKIDIIRNKKFILIENL